MFALASIRSLKDTLYGIDTNKVHIMVFPLLLCKLFISLIKSQKMT